MKRIYLYSSILISILLFATCRDTKKQSTGKDTQIEWIQKTWDFGEISEGEEVCHTFRFKSIGNYPFIIKKVETGCGCTTVSYDKAPVAPGKEGKLEISFNSESRYGKQYKEIRIFANIPEKQTSVRFTANVRE